jgi:Flp pilus assembly protein TadD
MSRNLTLAATLLSMALAPAALAGSKDKPVVPQSVAPQSGAAAQPAPPRKATAEERAEADRLEPLARAAFWEREAILDDHDTDAGVRLAAALRALDRNEEAARASQRVLVIDPANKDALLEAARDYVAGGQGFYAIEPIQRLQALDGSDWRTWSLLGVAYEQVGRSEDAEGAWKKALEISPANPAVLSNLAMHQAAKGNVAGAETLLRQAAAQPSASVQVRQNLALILGLQGKFVEAEQLQRRDLPPELASANMAYLHAAAGGTDSRSWKALQGAQAAAN